MERKLTHAWVIPLFILFMVILHGAVAHPVNSNWGQGFPWSPVRPYSVHPFLHWSLFHQLPSRVFSIHSPLATNLGPNLNTNRAENRLFPPVYGRNDNYNRAEHRLFPSHPDQDILARRPEHRHIVSPNASIEILPALTNKTMQDPLKNSTKLNRKMTKRDASTADSSAVIFPETPTTEHSPDPLEMLTEAPLGSQTATLDAPEDKKISTGGKFVLDGLSLIAGSILGGRPMGHHYSGFLASSAGYLPPPPPPPLPLHPSYPPFLFPGPSAIYPNFMPPYPPMSMGHHSYFPAASSNPYQPMSVDSLLVPLVGLVGLSLLVPDIIQTRREGRPSDLGGLDVFRYLNEDEDCLRRLACEAGVTISDNDDSVTIQRALERALAAKRLIPEQQMGSQQPQTIRQCGHHMCASWIAESAAESTSVTNGR